MKYTGTVKEGVVVFEKAPPFNNGTIVTVEAISGLSANSRGRAKETISSAMIEKWRGRARLPIGKSGEDYLRIVRDGDIR